MIHSVKSAEAGDIFIEVPITNASGTSAKLLKSGGTGTSF